MSRPIWRFSQNRVFVLDVNKFEIEANVNLFCKVVGEWFTKLVVAHAASQTFPSFTILADNPEVI